MTGPLPDASPGIERYEMVLRRVANRETPMRMGLMLPPPTKYSLVVLCLRLKYAPRAMVERA